MSQPKRRARKSKLVPRSTEGGEPEIEEVIELEDEDEPPIKIMNTMSLASQPGPSSSTGSVQFKVDIEVEEWIDDELFIEENFNKMQSEKLSKALDQEISEEADWTNEEYGKIWAETASDNEIDEKPLNEYEKIIKNQVDLSVLAGPSKDRAGLSKENEVRPGSSKDNDLRPGTSSNDRPKPRSAKRKKVTKPVEIEKNPPKTPTRSPPKNKETVPSPPANLPLPPLTPIRKYKRPGPKSKTMEKTVTETSAGEKTSTNEKSTPNSSISGKTFKWPKDTAKVVDLSTPKLKINIVYSDEPPTAFHIKPSDEPNINTPTSLKNIKILIGDPTTKRMKISELNKFTEPHISEPESVSDPDNSAMVSLKQISISEDAILADSKLLAAKSRDPIDHILNIEVRNRMGNTRFVPMEIAREDALIDFGLRLWFQWIGKNKVRTTPLSYKCYICNKAWWHLYQFRKHLKLHIFVNVSLERKNQECNIIAHLGKFNFKQIPIPEDCWKCGRNYHFHLGVVYTCQGCQSTLYNCKALAEHEGICLNIWKKQMEIQKTKDIKAYKCKICPQIFFTEALLHNHQYHCHVPRSDYPIWVQTSPCKHCNQSFVDTAFHYCSKRVLKYRCRYCSRHYPSLKALKAHMDEIKSNIACKVCKEVILRECMMPRHLIVHNNNYVMMYKCLMCVGKNVLLDDVTMVTRHAEFVHKSNKYVRSMWCFSQIPCTKTLSKFEFTTRHRPTPLHDKLKDSFLKDLLHYDLDRKIFNTEESLDSSDENSQDPESQDSQDSQEPQKSQVSLELQESQVSLELQESQVSLEPQKSQDSLEPQESQVSLEPQESQVSLEPQKFQVSLEPQESQISLEPQKSQVSLEPQESQVSLEPQESQVSLEPQESQVSLEPQESQVSLEPQESQVSLEPQESQVSLEPQENQVSLEPQESQVSLEPHESQVSLEPQESPMIKIENVMENYFEEDSSNIEVELKPKIIDTRSIKIEINENLEVTEVNPADLMDMTQTEFLSVVKIEKPDDDEMNSQSSNMDTHLNSSEADTSENVLEKDFSKQLQDHLSNRDEEEEEIKDNVNICLTCDFEGTKKEFKAHLYKCNSGEIAKKINQKFKCTKCSKEFRLLKEYVKHLPTHGFLRFKCTECEREFSNLYNWTMHIKMHIRRMFIIVKLIKNYTKVFRCRICKEFVERKMFFKHWEAHLELPEKNKALQSSPSVKVEGSLTPQVLNKIEEIFGMTKTGGIPRNCFLCDKYFTRMNEKKRHLVEHLLEAASEQILTHGGLVCQFCGVKVVKPDQYRRHMRDHAAITMYHCELCNKNFSDSSNFVKHKKVHDVLSFTCDVCNRKFLSKGSLEAHIARHRPEPLRCVHCPSKLFYSESAYNKHVRSYHDRGAGFRCQYCRERFLTLREKWDHLWDQHQVRSQIADCPICNRKFRKAQDVRSHIYNDHHLKKVFTYVPIEDVPDSK